MLDIIKDTIIDNILLLPFLFLTFLFIEMLEHKFTTKTKKIITKSGKLGPLWGSLLGIFPQCGFSVMATNFYITRIISLGTLISIYLSTSDEMLIVMLSGGAKLTSIIKLLAIKFLIGIISGFLIDFIFRKKEPQQENFHICQEEHCHCENNLLKSTIKHTFNIWIFLITISFILNIGMEYIGNDILKNIFNQNTFLTPLLTSLVGLIPNCGASVIITELYLNEVIPLSSTISGLLTGSGVALLVLFKSNNNLKENIKILLILYGIGVISGIFIELLEFI